MLKNSPRLNTENPTERSLRFLQPSPLEFPKLLKKVPFKKSSLYSTTYLNKLKTLLIWKDLLKRNVLKPIRKTEISLLFQSEWLTVFLLILKPNLTLYLISSAQLNLALKILINALLSRLKKELIVTTNVKKQLKIMKKQELLEHKTEMLYPRLSVLLTPNLELLENN